MIKKKNIIFKLILYKSTDLEQKNALIFGATQYLTNLLRIIMVLVKLEKRINILISKWLEILFFDSWTHAV